MATVSHERTPIGRALLSLQRRILGLIERTRSTALPADIEIADRLQCELYAGACNGPTEYHHELLKALNDLFQPKAAPSGRRG